MTLPNGEQGLDDAFNPWGVKNEISKLPDRTQPNIEEHFKELIQGNNAWNVASQTFFQNILGGFGSLENFAKLLVLAITGEEGDLTALPAFFSNLADTIADIIENVPGGDIIQALIDAFTQGTNQGGTPPTGVDGLKKVVQDFLGLFFNNKPPPLGTGGQTEIPDEENTSGGVIIGNNDLSPALEELFHNLVGAGAGGSSTKVPAHTLSALATKSGKNVLPDGDFTTAASIDGQGYWCWDWPGSGGGAWGSSGCVRTLRPGTIKIYFVPGTRVLLGQTGAIPSPKSEWLRLSTDYIYTEEMHKAKVWPPSNGGSLVDHEKFDFVVVPYPAAMFPMGESTTIATKWLINMIRATPGKFILMGWSQGGAVISNVYDELRYGTLQDRNDDLLLGVGIGNIRREKGRSFPGGPVYDPDGWGAFEPTLANTEDRWWEWAVPAGTYPAFGKLDGITWDTDDVASCLKNTSQTDKQIRQIIKGTMQAQNMNILAGLGVAVQFLTTPGGKLLQKAVGPNESHATSVFVVQPFLAQGDDRTMWQIIWDHINSLGHLATPATNDVPHKIWASTPIPVQERHSVGVKGKIAWENMPNTNGAEIILGADVWDSNGNYIPGDVPGQPTVIASQGAITNPVTSSDFVDLEATLVMPDEGDPTTACLSLWLSPQAMKKATVWFDKAEFDQSGLINAELFDNIQNIPQLSALSVEGAQGMEDLLSTLQTFIDGFVSANKGSNMSEQALADLFASQAQVALTANQALAKVNELIESGGGPGSDLEQDWSGSFTTPGEHTFPLPPWIAEGDYIDGICLGGGASGAITPARGGSAGNWGWNRLVYGTDVPLGTTELKVIVAAGVTSGGNAGTNGNPTQIRLPDNTLLINANGGLAGPNSPNTTGKGLGPGNFSFPPTGEMYFGGSDVANAKPGQPPGGGGGAGNLFLVPGPGAAGAAWITVRDQT